MAYLLNVRQATVSDWETAKQAMPPYMAYVILGLATQIDDVNGN